jgi:hypothetical protein
MGHLRRSFVPPEPVRDLRALTRLRANLTHDRVRHQNRIEKILEDALLKVSSVISDLMGAAAAGSCGPWRTPGAAPPRWPRSAITGCTPARPSWRRP